MKAPRQWQCTCGAWIDTGWWRHPHVGATAQANTLEQMRALRVAEEAGISHAVNAVAETVEISTYWRTGKEPQRDTPTDG